MTLRPMNVIFLGPPGSGKGTQAAVLCDKKRLAHISTGDMLRAEIKKDSPLGNQVKEKMARGELIDDQLIIELVKERIKDKDCERGFVLDGVPRTLEQAQALSNQAVPIDYVIEFQCPTDLLIQRLTSRRVHPASGRIYNLLYNPPKRENQDDISGEPLVQRDDDKEDTVHTRIRDYHDKTEPLRDYYHQLAKQSESIKYHCLDASLPADQINQSLLKALHR